MYVLVRLDLAESYRMVQGAHALAKYALEHESLFKSWNNSTIVFLGVRNLTVLRSWVSELNDKQYSVFYEPDMDNQETAIACWDTGEIFKSLRTA